VICTLIRIMKKRRMRWAGHVARMWAKRNAYRLLVGKPEGKRRLGRPRRRWVDGSCEGGMGLAQDRDRWRALVKSLLDLGVP
jgi:hypothetical protein